MADFHFIRPLWLLAILALLFAVYLLKKYRLSQSGWQQLLPNHLSKILLDEQQDQKSLSVSTTVITPFIIGLLTIIALAGPTWQKLPQPVFQLSRGSVLIMDMSYSMLATDLTPNRLTRARYKATDLLDNLNEGQMGLVAYAGDAFVISPLTEDINNIKLLLPSLSPDIMPELGSNPLAALTLAHEMLLNAGHVQGDIYWFTDGIDQEDQQDITNWSRETPHRLNILGIGSKSGAPIKLTNGELMKDNSGAIVIPKLPESLLYGSAKRGRGIYQSISNDSSDIESLLSRTFPNKKSNKEQNESQSEGKSEESNNNDMNEDNPNIGDQWQETGPYLLLLVLPLVLIYFRRGNLVALLPLSLLLFPNEQAFADTWQDLWKTNDQQAQQKFNKEAYNDAAQQFENPLWQGSSHYKAGNFEDALTAFKQHDTAEALYNQGNTLAKLNKLDEAIQAYDDALKKDPDLTDAQANKALLEQLKQQQEQQSKDNNEQQDQDSKEQDKKDKSEQDQQSQDQQNKDQQQQDQQDSKQDSEKNDSEQKNQDQQESENKEEQSEQQKSEEEQQKQKEKENKKEKEQQKQAEEAEKQQDGKEEEKDAQSQQAKLAAEKLAQEKEQKHQQLLNKVTDDPYLLLRNKMQLEYQKRRQNQSSLGAKKKW